MAIGLFNKLLEDFKQRPKIYLEKFVSEIVQLC